MKYAVLALALLLALPASATKRISLRATQVTDDHGKQQVVLQPVLPIYLVTVDGNGLVKGEMLSCQITQAKDADGEMRPALRCNNHRIIFVQSLIFTPSE